MTAEEKESWKKWIDEASYEDLLFKWRYSPAGDPIFLEVNGLASYYEKVMVQKRDENPAAAVAASKRIGWND